MSENSVHAAVVMKELLSMSGAAYTLALLYAGSVMGLAPLEKELRAGSPEGADRWSLPLYLARTLDNERTRTLLRQTVRETHLDGLQIEAARALCLAGDSIDLLRLWERDLFTRGHPCPTRRRYTLLP